MKKKVAKILQTEAMQSLARTDNLLLALNVVVLAGAIATIYGALAR